MFRLFEECAVVVVQVAYLLDLAAQQVMERAGLQQGVAEILDT